jgi:NAD(P)-dependent dehydrogenase (short-subunit alcohol dehydrogenase family)
MLFRFDMTTLITGANRGLGYEFARQLVATGHQVRIGVRSRVPYPEVA